MGGTGCFAGKTGVVTTGTSEDDEFTYEIDLLEEVPDDCPDSLFAMPWVETYDGLFVDWDANGNSPGDVFVFDTNELVTGGGINGFVEGECMFLEELSLEKLFCTITYWFDESEDRLLAMGLFDEMVIVGGTGCFLGASGTVSGFDPDDGTLEYTVSLDDPDSASDSACVDGIFDDTWSEPFGDTFVDYNGIDDDTFGETPGDIYVFDNKVVTIPLPGGASTEGTMAGRCFSMPSDDDLF